MLPRRRMLGAATCLVAPAVLTPLQPVRAQVQRTMRLGYLLPILSQLGAGATVMADAMARRTGGRVVIQQFPGAALGDELEMLKSVQRGRLDLAFITGAPLMNILPDVGVFDIPFLFKSSKHARGVLDGPIGDEYRQRFAAKDLVALAWGENGLRHLTNARRQVITPNDVRGLRLRLPQSEIMLLGFKALGATVAPLPFPQLYDALRLGTFDGQENPIATIQAAKFNMVQKFLTLTGHVYDPALLVMSPDLFDQLVPAERAAIMSAARLGAAASRQFVDEAERTGVTALQQAGMQVVATIDRDSFAAGMASAVPEFEARFGRDEIERIRQAA